MCGGRERDVRTVLPVYAGALGTVRDAACGRGRAGDERRRWKRGTRATQRGAMPACDPDYDVQRADTHVHGSVDVKIIM